MATLADACTAAGVEILYESTASRLLVDNDGEISGVLVTDPEGQCVIESRTVIIASGGFEGNPEMLTQYLGRDATGLKPIAPGGEFNKGEGIRMALSVGAKSAGESISSSTTPKCTGRSASARGEGSMLRARRWRSTTSARYGLPKSSAPR